MSLVICSRPECQTTAGCQCGSVWRNPAPHAAAPMVAGPYKVVTVSKPASDTATAYCPCCGQIIHKQEK